MAFNSFLKRIDLARLIIAAFFVFLYRGSTTPKPGGTDNIQPQPYRDVVRLGAGHAACYRLRYRS